jgi:hypothetical protein
MRRFTQRPRAHGESTSLIRVIRGRRGSVDAKGMLFMAERMKARVGTVPADHVPMITAVPAVVDLLLEAVHEVESSR